MSNLMKGHKSMGHVATSFSKPRVAPRRGTPLPDEIRRDAEELFGEDFSDVRVIVSDAAPKIGAIAFTTGSEIHIAPGVYRPGTEATRALLGHELAHVVQQRRGRVTNPHGYGVAVVRDQGLEAEADRMGRALQMMQQMQQNDGKSKGAKVCKQCRIDPNPRCATCSRNPGLTWRKQGDHLYNDLSTLRVLIHNEATEWVRMICGQSGYTTAFTSETNPTGQELASLRKKELVLGAGWGVKDDNNSSEWGKAVKEFKETFDFFRTLQEYERYAFFSREQLRAKGHQYLVSKLRESVTSGINNIKDHDAEETLLLKDHKLKAQIDECEKLIQTYREKFPDYVESQVKVLFAEILQCWNGEHPSQKKNEEEETKDAT